MVKFLGALKISAARNLPTKTTNQQYPPLTPHSHLPLRAFLCSPCAASSSDPLNVQTSTPRFGFHDPSIPFSVQSGFQLYHAIPCTSYIIISPITIYRRCCINHKATFETKKQNQTNKRNKVMRMLNISSFSISAHQRRDHER